MKKYAYQYIKNINKNIFTNLLINVSRHTRTLLFQKLPSLCTTPTSTPKPKSTPVLPRSTLSKSILSSCSSLCKLISSLKFSSSSSTFTISFYSFILIILYIYIYIYIFLIGILVSLKLSVQKIPVTKKVIKL